MITQEQIESVALKHDGYDAGCTCAGCKLRREYDRRINEAEMVYKESQTLFKAGLDLRNKQRDAKKK